VVTIGGAVIVPKVIRGALDGNGNLSVSLPATDDPDLDVTGWTYTVTEHIADAGRPPFQIEVPYSATSIDLSTVAPAVSLPVAVQTALTRYDIGVTVASETEAAKKADLAAPTGAGLVGVQVGSTSRTVAAKLGEVVSVKDFGAVGDGATDDTVATQAALDYLNSIGGGTLFLPKGLYRKSDSTASLVMYSNITIEGVGDASAFFFDDKDTVARSGNDFMVCDNTSNIAFRNFRITGTALTYTNETNQKQCLTGSNIDGLLLDGVTIEKVRYMATAFANVKNARVTGCELDYIVRDGLRFTNSYSVAIVGNNLRRVTDDSVALHAIDANTPPGGGFVVEGNTFEACQGIKVLGAKQLTVRGNVMRRMLRSPVVVQLAASGSEGNTPQFAIDVSANNITDTFGDRGTNYNIYVGTLAARANGGLTTQPGVNSAPYAYDYLNDLDTGTPVKVGQFGIRVCDNIIARTLNTGSAYSAWGYGSLFDRTTTNFVSDPTIASTAFQCHGINLVAPVNGLQVTGNNLSGLGTGFTAILLQITGTTNIQDYANTVIASNVIFDCPGLGVSCTTLGSGSGAKQVVIQNNTFDLDPFFRASTHNADNTWSSTGSVVAISCSNTVGFLAGGNVFKNMGQTGIAGSVTTELGANVVYADFVSAGDNVSNKGVRQLPSASLAVIVPIDGDPTSATFGQIANAINTRAASIPTSGRYVAGHRVLKDTPTVAGSAGSQYTVTGWWRVTTGAAHVLNTDWVEMRCLTGT
jgi:hypothetical protein